MSSATGRHYKVRYGSNLQPYRTTDYVRPLLAGRQELSNLLEEAGPLPFVR